MGDVRKIEHTGERVETGPLQIGDDWPGFFIRGDNALALWLGIEALLLGRESPIERCEVEAFSRKLRGVEVKHE